MFGVADHAGTLAAATAGYCPDSVSSLSTIVRDACSAPGVCSDTYRSVEWAIDNVIPTARRLQHTMLDTVSVFLLLGAAVSFTLTSKGIRSTARAYELTYEHLYEHGPPGFRFPLRKADSVRLLSTMVAYCEGDRCTALRDDVHAHG
eukprot:6192685-Prymnesium_polylepis.1